MTNKNIKQILNKLEDHEKRIRVLEVGKSKADGQLTTHVDVQKQLTLAELIRGKSFKAGQEKVAVIVGYYEKILHKEAVKEADIKEGWKKGKFDGKYSPNLLARAIKDGLVRNIDGSLDLSQTGEKFFENFLKLNVGVNQTGSQK